MRATRLARAALLAIAPLLALLAGPAGEARGEAPVEAQVLDASGAAIDPSRSGLELSRHPPSRLPDDPFSPTGENTFRVVISGDRSRLAPSITLASRGADGRAVDSLELSELREQPCPQSSPPGLVCLSTLPLRLAIDPTDRDHPVARGRSIEAELGGAIDISMGNQRLASTRVVGPRQTELGPIERLRARLRVLLVRDRPKGAPPFGATDAIAIDLARQQIARANAVWGQCGISFGPPEEADVRLVDPPGPSMLAVGCDLGLAASGGAIRLRADGREVRVEALEGESPRAVARKVARALEARGLRAVVSDNLRIGPGADATSDVLVRRRDGSPAVLSPIDGARVSTDATLSACIGQVDFSDGLQHFSDVDAVAGTVEERALLKAIDDGDGRTVEVVLIPSFATGGRIGESFIRGDRSSLSNMILEDRAGIRADNVSFAMAHELGHVLLDVPGHSDDFGADTPSRLMDSDAADPSAFGPRRLLLAECSRALRQSGPASPTPLLSPWPLGKLPEPRLRPARPARPPTARPPTARPQGPRRR